MFPTLRGTTVTKTQSPRLFGWIHFFVLVQFLLQILLLFPQFGAIRAVMRVAGFGISLFLLTWLPGPGIYHPAKKTVFAVFIILGLQLFFNPSLNSLTAGAAHLALYVAIMGPLFWVSRLKISLPSFRWLIYLMWSFHTISAAFGVLQVYNPGQFQPALSTAVQSSQWGGENLKIELANGELVYRPMGLTDVPGGAATAGFYALLLGTGIALQARHPLLRLAGIGSGVIGLFCIYLSQVRSILIFSVICLAFIGLVLLRQGKVTQVTAMATAAVGGFSAVFGWAVAVGGNETLERIMSLFGDDPTNVYHQNRGHFLDATIREYLPRYPLGAGLGRWGPLNGYFGDNSNPLTKNIWVEIQWTGWLFDGGVPLIIAYVAALAITSYVVWKIATSPGADELRLWAAVILGYNVGVFVITFNYPLFIGQGGMEFWFLNASLFTASYYQWSQSQGLKQLSQGYRILPRGF